MADEEKKNESAPNSAGSGGQSPVNAAVKAAQDEAALLAALVSKEKSEKEIAESRRDRMKAELMPVAPSDKVTAPTGDITTDAAGFIETQILGQQAARKIANLLAKDLKAYSKIKPLKKLVIYNAADIETLKAYGAILQELKQLGRELEGQHGDAEIIIAEVENVLKSPDFEPPAAVENDPMTATALLAAPAIATGVVKSIAELVNLFRTTTDIKNRTLAGIEDLVVSQLVAEFNRPKPPVDISVYTPAIFPPHLFDSSDETELVEELTKLRKGRFTAQNDLKEINSLVERLAQAVAETRTDLQDKNSDIKTKETELGKLAPGDAQRPVLEKALGHLLGDKNSLKKRLVKFGGASSDLDDLKTKLQFVAAAAEQTLGGLESPDATTKIAPLTKLLVVARLHKILSGEDAYTLRFIVAANGTTKIKKNFFWNAKVLHSAGASLSYQLFDRTGVIAHANVFQWYFQWNSSEQISEMLDKINNSLMKTNEQDS